MDAMALLCNLQADGPATLRKLSELGCTTLDDLDRIPVFELADALGSDAGFAQRFLREARALRQRFSADEPEPEEARVPLPGSARLAAARSARETAARETPPPAATEEPPTLPAASRVVRATHRPLRELSPNPPQTPLREGLFEGLDATWCKALIGQGVLTVETLIDAPGLALARALGRRYTELLDLQSLAKRHLGLRDAAITIERDDASEPEVVRTPARARATPPAAAPISPAATPGTRVGRRPLEQPCYTIFPPAPPAERSAPPPTEGRAEAAPSPSTLDTARAARDAGTAGPFA